MNRIKKRWVFVGFSLFFMVSFAVLYGRIGTPKIHIGKDQICIPSRYVSEMSALSWIYLIPGLDNAGDYLNIDIPSNEFVDSIPGYHENDHGVRDYVGVLIAHLSDEEVTLTRNNQFYYELWNASGIYQEREIEFDSSVGAYRAYTSSRKAPNPPGWVLFRVEPGIDPAPDNILDHVIANCRAGRKFSDGYQLISCFSDIIVNNLRVRFDFTGINLQHYDQMEEFIRRKIEKWMC
jgi:hypothetical protein